MDKELKFISKNQNKMNKKTIRKRQKTEVKVKAKGKKLK